MTAGRLEEQIGIGAVAVYTVLQGAKALLPVLEQHLRGWRAVGLNILLAAVTVIGTSPAPFRFTAATLASIVLMASAAAGVHGTVSKLSGTGCAEEQRQP